MEQPGFSYWEQTAFTGNADVIIIGSGLVGLSAALNIKEQAPRLNVLVLERGFLPSGASTKNAGFACFGTVSEHLAALKQMPEHELVQQVNYKWRGLQRLKNNLGEAAIGYHEYGGHELFFDDQTEAAEICRDNIDKLNRLLKDAVEGHDIYAVDNEKIAAFGLKGVSQVIFNPYEGQIHTGKMMRVLLMKVQELGVLVLNNCKVSNIEQRSNSVEVSTDHGTFSASQAIIATNAFARDLYTQLDVVPGRGQVLVTTPIKGLKLKGTYHFNEGYYYFRNVDGRVLFGGGRELDLQAEETYQFGHTDRVQGKLLKYLKENILPGVQFGIETWWSGIMGFGNELRPIIKQLDAGIFCAVRCNGMGVAMGSLVGEEVAELALMHRA